MNLTKYFHDFKSKRILIVGDAILANIAGGIVCEKVGVVPINNTELLERAKKILNE